MCFLGTSHYLQGGGHLTEKKFGLSFWRVNFMKPSMEVGHNCLAKHVLSDPAPL